MTQLGSAYGEIRIGTGGAERSVQSLADKMRNVGTRMSLGISLPLAAVGKMGLQAAGNFEQSLNTIQSVAGATAEQMSAMSARALQLGKDTSFSAGEAAEGMLELAKAGLTADQSMASISGVLDLAAAGSLSVASAAEIASNALNSFGLDADQAGRVADLLAAAANASSIEVTDMAQSFQASSSVFAANKQSIEDLSTAIAILGNNGIKGSDAGTSLKTMMTRLAAPTDTAAKEMAKLGLQVYNTDGSMRSFEDIVKNLQESTMGLSDAQRNQAYNTIFGADAIRAASILVGTGAAEWDNMERAVTKAGAAQQVAQARMKGLNGAFAYIKGTVESTLIKAFLPFTELLGDSIRQVADLIAKFGDLPQPIINAALAFAAVLAAAGPLLVAIPAIGAVVAALASPIGAIVLAAAGFAAAWAANWGDIQGKTATVVAAIQELLTGLWTGITTGDWEPLKTSLTEIGTAIATSVTAWAAALTDWAKDVWATLSINLAALNLNLLSWIRVISDLIRFNMPAWVASFTDWAKDVWATLGTNLATMWTSLTSWIGGKVDILYAHLSKWSAEFWGWATEVWATLSTNLATLMTSVTSWIGGQVDVIYAHVSKWVDEFVTWATEVWPRLSTNLVTLATSVTGWIGGQVDVLYAHISKWTKEFTGWVKEVWPTLQVNLQVLGQQIIDWAKEQGPRLQVEVSKWRKIIGDWAPPPEVTKGTSKKVGSDLATGFLDVQETVSTGFGYMVGAAIGGAIRFASEGVALFVTGIIGSINNIFARPKSSDEVGISFWGMIVSMIKNVPKAFGAVGVGFWDQIKAYLGGAPADLLEAEWTKLGENAKQVWTAALDSLKTSADTKWIEIVAAVTTFGTNLESALNATLINIDFAWQTMVTSVKSTVSSWASNIQEKFSSAKSNATKITETLRNNLVSIWNAIRARAEAIFGAIKAAIDVLVKAKDNVVAAFNDFKTFVAGLTFSNPFGGLVRFIQGVINKANAAVAALSALTGAQQSAPSGGSGPGSGGGTGGFNAMGDHFWRGGLTWVGERGPELIDVPRGARIYDNTSSKQMGQDGGITVNVTNIIQSEIDYEMAAHRTAQIIQRYQT